jgi:hypothetical protein
MTSSFHILDSPLLFILPFGAVQSQTNASITVGRFDEELKKNSNYLSKLTVKLPTYLIKHCVTKEEHQAFLIPR